MVFIRKSFVLIVLVLFFSFKKGEEQHQYTIRGYAQGTDYTVKYFAPDSVVTKQAIDSILAVIDSSMSLYKSYSRINRFNASEKGMQLDPHFLKVMRKSFEIYKATNGKFDVTVKPLVQAWGFGVRPIESFPDSAAIREILKCVGMGNLELKKDFLKKSRSCLQVDLNGIAQGYSVDVVANHLIYRGIKAFVVEIGGELRMQGPKPDGSSLKIGIEGPSDDPGAEPEIVHTIALNQGAVTTSGNYRKFLQKGNGKIAHLINPKTGYPLDNALISVTIYAKDAISADGYDNAVMAMGLEEALAFVGKKKGMEAYIIYRNQQGVIADTLTSGFRKMTVN